MGDQQARRRRRVRHPADSADERTQPNPTADDLVDDPAVAVVAAVAITAETVDPVSEDSPVAVLAAEPDPSPAERGLRGLIGGGSSQVKPTVAMRARDAARARDADLARAEAELTIVRRNWSPRE